MVALVVQEVEPMLRTLEQVAAEVAPAALAALAEMAEMAALETTKGRAVLRALGRREVPLEPAVVMMAAPRAALLVYREAVAAARKKPFSVRQVELELEAKSEFPSSDHAKQGYQNTLDISWLNAP